ncbi:MAG: cytochrome-c peroxidase [Candidatus Eiseniibacteriota bacterium]
MVARGAAPALSTFVLAFGLALTLQGCGEGGFGPARYPAPDPAAVDTQGLLPLPDAPGNPLTVQGIELGRRLFHDPILSADSTQSCATCHVQAFAFTDNGTRFSTGIDGSVGTRNAPPLVNLAWHPDFFWEGRAPTLEDQARAPVPNPIEMKLPWEEALARLRAHREYPELFGRAFRTEEVSQDRVVKAIAQFERTLVSNRSTWDRHQRDEIALTPAQERGERVFFSERGDCFRCHGSAFFTDHDYHDNGLDAAPTDPGRFDVTGLETDRGKFRSPTLRNVELTAPYMHDGRFATLEEVVAHYSSGVQDSPNLDPLLRVRLPGGLGMTPAEQADLVEFLKALTDPEFVTDPAFGPGS